MGQLLSRGQLKRQRKTQMEDISAKPEKGKERRKPSEPAH